MAVGIGDLGQEGAVHHGESLGDAGVVVGVLDGFAVALAEFAEVVAAGRGAFEFGGAEGAFADLISNLEVGAAEFFVFDAVEVGFFFVGLLGFESDGRFFLLGQFGAIITGDHDFFGLGVVGHHHGFPGVHHHGGRGVSARCIGGDECGGFAGDLLIELLLAGGDDFGEGDLAAFVLNAIHLAADVLVFLFHFGDFSESGDFGRAIGHHVGFVGGFLVGGAGLDVEFLLDLGALPIFAVNISGFFEADEGFFGGEHFDAVGDFFGLKDALLHGVAIGLVDHVRAGIDEGDEGVPHLFGGHAAKEGAGEVVDGSGGVFGAGDLGLVGFGIVEDAKDGLHVVVGADDEFFEVFLQFWNHGDGGVHEFVKRFDESETEGAFPEAVSDDGGEARVFGVGHPFGVGFERRLTGFGDGFMTQHGAWGDAGFGFCVWILVVVWEGRLAIFCADGGVAHGIADVGHGFLIASLFQADFLAGLFALFVHGGDLFRIGLKLAGVFFFCCGFFLLGGLFVEFGALGFLRIFERGPDGVFLILEEAADA